MSHVKETVNVAVSFVTLTKGRVAMVDSADMPLISKTSWHTSPAGRRGDREYARGRRAGKNVLMHRLLLAAPKGSQVDHINGRGLDNRRENLRLATASQNAAWGDLRQARFRGVHRGSLRGKPWRSRIKVGQRVYGLGSFDDPESAARAYDHAALKTWGEFARLNFPDEVAA